MVKIEIYICEMHPEDRQAHEPFDVTTYIF